MKKVEDSSAASKGAHSSKWAPLHDVCQANVVATADRLVFEPVGFMVNRKAMPALEGAVRAIQRLHDAHRRVECRGRRVGSSSAAKARDPIARLRREQRRLALASKAVIGVGAALASLRVHGLAFFARTRTEGVISFGDDVVEAFELVAEVSVRRIRDEKSLTEE